MTTRMAWLVLALSACGYPESAVQSQRNQIAKLQSALVDVSLAAATYESTIAKLTADNDALRLRCVSLLPVAPP